MSHLALCRSREDGHIIMGAHHMPLDLRREELEPQPSEDLPTFFSYANALREARSLSEVTQKRRAGRVRLRVGASGSVVVVRVGCYLHAESASARVSARV